MDIRRDLLDLPRALRETLEKGGPEYDKLVRRTRWGDGPLYIVASGTARAAGLAGAYAFETLVGLPTVVRGSADFLAYSLSALRPRSILLAIADSGESTDTLELVRAAKSRGATVLALTSDARGELAKEAEGVFLVRAGEEHSGSPKAGVCCQAAACYLGFVAARALKRPHAHLRDLEEEFPKLPEHVEWALSQLSEAVRPFASELKSASRVYVAGGGFYHASALHGTTAMRKLAGTDACAFNALEPEIQHYGPRERGASVILLSGSHCRSKKRIHALAEGQMRAGTRILAITDQNDPELSRRSALAILLPVLSEEVGSIVSLALLDWVAYHAGRERSGGKARALTGQS